MGSVKSYAGKEPQSFKLMDIDKDWQGYTLFPLFSLKFCHSRIFMTKLPSINIYGYSWIDTLPDGDPLSDEASIFWPQNATDGWILLTELTSKYQKINTMHVG